MTKRWKQLNWITRDPKLMICRVVCRNLEGFYVPKIRGVYFFHQGRTFIADVYDTCLVPEEQEVWHITEQEFRLAKEFQHNETNYYSNIMHIITNYLITREDDATSTGDDGRRESYSTDRILGSASRS